MLVAMPTAIPEEPFTRRFGKLRRQDKRLVLAAVVVRTEIHGLLVEVGEELVGDLRHADLGVAHRRGVVAVDRAEVALAIDQRIAQAELLRHAHDRVVHGGVAVRVVLADDVAYDARGLLVRLVPIIGELVHREEHAAVDGLQAVAHVGQRTPDDHAHGVVEIRAPHLLLERDRVRFLGELFHGFDGEPTRTSGSVKALFSRDFYRPDNPEF
jgi:hypothetical protein